jgi:hypothetical protein
MAALTPTTTLIPYTPTIWYTFPQISKRLPPVQRRNRHSDLSRKGRMKEPDNLPVSTGPEHWEAQRKKWTKGFSERHDRNNEVQHHLKIVLIQDPYGIEDADYERLVKAYKLITNDERPYRIRLRLKHLLAILVAGWKDAGIYFCILWRANFRIVA